MYARRDPRHWASQAALLSISLMLVTSLAITPAIPALIEAFPTYSRTQIEMLPTVTTAAMLVSVLFSGVFVRLIGKTGTVMAGLALVLLCGCAPGFASSYPFIFACRVGLGIGLGSFNALAISMISDHYRGSKRASLIGMRNACENLGQASMTLVAGALLTQGWHQVFYLYALAAPIMLFFALWAPRETSGVIKDRSNACTHQEHATTTTSASTSMRKLGNSTSREPLSTQQGIRVAIIALFLSFTTAASVSVSVRLPSLWVDEQLGSMESSGVVLAVMTLCGLAAGLSFGTVMKRLGWATLLLGLALMTASCYLLFFGKEAWIVVLGAMCAGMANTTVGSFIFSLVSEIFPHSRLTFVSSLLIAGCNLGAFSTPVLLRLLGGIANSSNLAAPFLTLAIIATVLTLIFATLLPTFRKKWAFGA